MADRAVMMQGGKLKIRSSRATESRVEQDGGSLVTLELELTHDAAIRLLEVLERGGVPQLTGTGAEQPAASQTDDQEGPMTLGEVVIDTKRRLVLKNDRVIELTTLEFDLLVYLANRRDEVIPREDLLREVWGYTEGVYTNTLNTRISRIRRKLGRRKDGKSFIETVRAFGYRFSAAPDTVPPMQ